MDLPPLELFVQNTQGGGVLGGDDDAARVAVDAVDEGGRETVFVLRHIFAFFKQIPLHAENEGVPIFVFIRMNQKSCGFVEEQEVVILIDNGKLPSRRHEIRRGGRLVQNIVFEVDGDNITGANAGRNLAALTVQFDVFGADTFIHEGWGEIAEGLCQQLVETLTGIVGIDDHCFHSTPAFILAV